MASQGYRDWLNAGRPYALIRPAAALVGHLRGRGLTVWHYPNAAHLEATTPEDHTPFSVTGWPGTNRRWNARGVDVMPRSTSAAHRKENADIARQLIRDRDAGHPGAMWIKYLNWTDENGVCRQERWMDASAPLRRTTRSSSDKGHIHISGRSDADNDDRADGYDPIARMTGGDDDVDPLLAAKIDAVYNALETTTLPGGGDKLFTVPLTAKLNELGDKVDALAAKLDTPVDGDIVQGGPLELSDADVDRIAEALAAKLATRLAS